MYCSGTKSSSQWPGSALGNALDRNQVSGKYDQGWGPVCIYGSTTKNYHQVSLQAGMGLCTCLLMYLLTSCESSLAELIVES